MGKEIKYNLNDFIKVKLTPLAKSIFYHQFDEANDEYLRDHGEILCKPYYPEEDENGYSTMQLWRFAHLYGPHMWVGCPPLVERMEIILGGDYIKESTDAS